MIKKHKILYGFLLLSLTIVVVFSSFHTKKEDPKQKVRIIVIDPGHGGKDPGCNGSSCKEKEVSLAVALKLGKLLEENLKDVKVIFTRTTDVFVELEDRAKIANDNHADLFISIHCNASGKPVMIKDKKTGKLRAKTYKNSKGKIKVVETANPVPYGAETYVMGLKNEAGKMKVAQRENSAMLLEDNYETKYQGFDPNSEESYIIMSNYTSSYVIQSAGLAIKIQEQYTKKAGRTDKGVHRQSIWVLWRTSMPSVLTEIGYLTNPQEEKFLCSEKGQNSIASCLFRAIRQYKDEQENVKKNYDDAIENEKPLEKEIFEVPKTSEPRDSIEDDDSTAIKDVNDTLELKIIQDAEKKVKEIAAQKEKEAIAKKNKEIAEEKAKVLAEKKAKDLLLEKQIAASNKAKADSINEENAKNAKVRELENKYKSLIAIADVSLKNKKYNEALALYNKANDLKEKKDSYSQQKISEIENTLKTMADDLAKTNAEKNNPKTEVTNTITVKNDKSTNILFKVQFASTDKEMDVAKKHPNVDDVSFYKAGAVYKYTSGNYKTMAEAAKQQTKLRQLGYTDCFVAAFNNGVRIDVNEAKKIVQ